MGTKKIILAAAAILTGYKLYRACSPVIPSYVVPVTGFEVNRYLGKWYEVGRIDNRFEKGLINTTAQYALNDDGSLNVLNSGIDNKTGRFKHASGTAKFMKDTYVGALKVSFFGPFYGGYNIVDLDEDYRWAVVIGSSRDFFWVLSRTVEIPETVKERAIKIASEAGIDPSKINWVEHY